MFADVFALSKSYEIGVLRVVSKLSRVCNLSLTNRIKGDKEGSAPKELQITIEAFEDRVPKLARENYCANSRDESQFRRNPHRS